MFDLIALLAFAASGPRPSELKVFQDWIVGCDNVLYCEAIALLPEDGWDDYRTLSIGRGPEPAAPISITTSAEGDPVERLSAGREVLEVPSSGSIELELEEVQPLLGAVRTSDLLEVQDSAGVIVGKVSLKGASAALLYMDEMQRRVGTETALVRPGPRPASAVPAAPLPPSLKFGTIAGRSPQRAAEAELRKLQKNCDVPVDGRKADFYLIGRNQTLALVPCMAGAYNSIDTPLIIEMVRGKKVVRLAEFDHPTPESGEGEIVVSNASWEETGRLLTYHKGRGIGDCGHESTYIWDGQTFRLEHREEMPVCRGSTKFITTYQAMTDD